MHEDVLKKLAQRVDRRSFLRGSGLAAAALVGATVLPQTAFAQDDKAGQGKSEEKDPFKETKTDERGRPYRVCPQCGFNMYQQEKVWTCDNCGYSYTE